MTYWAINSIMPAFTVGYLICSKLSPHNYISWFLDTKCHTCAPFLCRFHSSHTHSLPRFQVSTQL